MVGVYEVGSWRIRAFKLHRCFCVALHFLFCSVWYARIEATNTFRVFQDSKLLMAVFFDRTY
jgi:hypothetical protein